MLRVCYEIFERGEIKTQQLINELWCPEAESNHRQENVEVLSPE